MESKEKLEKIIGWYAAKVYYDMTHPLDEIEWLVDNLKPNAFKEVQEYCEEFMKEDEL